MESFVTPCRSGICSQVLLALHSCLLLSCSYAMMKIGKEKQGNTHVDELHVSFVQNELDGLILQLTVLVL